MTPWEYKQNAGSSDPTEKTNYWLSSITILKKKSEGERREREGKREGERQGKRKIASNKRDGKETYI